MSNWFIESEAWKFYRLRSELFVRLGFVGLFGLRFIFHLFSVDGPDLSSLPYLRMLDPEEAGAILRQMLTESLPYLLLEVLVLFIGFIFLITYAMTMVFEETAFYDGNRQAEEDLVLKRNLENFRMRVQLSRQIRESLAKQGRSLGQYPYKMPSKEADGVNQEDDTGDQFPDLAGQKQDQEASWQVNREAGDEASEPQGSISQDLAHLKLTSKYQDSLSASIGLLLPALPKLLLLLILAIFIYGISSLLLGIPFLFVLGAFHLLPLFFLEKQKLSSAVNEAWQDSYGFKLFMVSKYFFFYIVFSLCEALILSIFMPLSTSHLLLDSLLFSLKCLVYGRLLGIAYLTVGKRKCRTLTGETLSSL